MDKQQRMQVINNMTPQMRAIWVEYILLISKVAPNTRVRWAL